MAQNRVTRRMAKSIIDILEAVEIDEQHGEASSGPLQVGEKVAEGVIEGRTVAEPGERVGMGKLRQPVLEIHRPAMFLSELLEERAEQEDARQNDGGRD
jgi:hypothetical protein